MRKQDIKPGVVYAYKRGRGDFDMHHPIVFLAAPADGVLYNEPHRYTSDAGKPVFERVRSGVKPGHSSIYGPTGYPAVMLGWNAPEGTEPEALLRYTLAGYEAATSATPDDGVTFEVITSLTPIVGTYTDAMAEYEAQRRARREQQERDYARRNASHARADTVLAALARAGIKAQRDTGYSTVQAITVSLDEAEKLIRLLNGED